MVKKRGKKTEKASSKVKTAKSKSPKTKRQKGFVIKKKLKRSSRIERLKSIPALKPLIHKGKKFEEKTTRKLMFSNLAGKDHIRHPNYGIKLVMGYTGFIALVYFIYFILSLIKPSLSVLRAQNSFIIDIFMLVWVFGVVYGFHERKAWAWKLSMGWFAFMIFYSVIIMRFIQQGAYNISTELFTLAILSIILINAFIIWYVYKKKDYFIGEDHGIHYNKEDKIFVYTIVCFWVLLIAISVSVGMNFYSDTKEMTNNLVMELGSVVPVTGFEGGAATCNTKDVPERDVCYLILTTMADGEYDYCDKIDSQIYKYTCLQAMGS